MMEHEGYIGKVEFDDEAEIFHGEVINTRDVITFQGKSAAELKQAFRESIDEYLAFCAERGEAPDKPYSGQFVTRISPELHREISVAASIEGVSLNSWVQKRLENAIKRGRIRDVPLAEKQASGVAARSKKKVAGKKTTRRSS